MIFVVVVVVVAVIMIVDVVARLIFLRPTVRKFQSGAGGSNRTAERSELIGRQAASEPPPEQPMSCCGVTGTSITTAASGQRGTVGIFKVESNKKVSEKIK